MRSVIGRAVIVGALTLLFSGVVGAQTRPDPMPAAIQASVDPELESYLRTLQILGKIAPGPWSVRGFSADQISRMAPGDTTDHPWAGRFDFSLPSPRVDAGWVLPRAEITFNSSYPYGFNDGPVWSGRGFTASAAAGAWAQAGPFSVTIAPVVWWAQNRDFDAGLEFGDWRSGRIDRPVRFGSTAITTIDGGESAVRIDLRPVSIGVGTGPQAWGPAQELPLVLGRNAPGFQHAFLGTSHPADVWVGRLHVRFIAGRLEQSDFAPESQDDVRLGAGWVLSFSPRGLDGLELGATRFFHQPWGNGPGLDALTKPFESFLKFGLEGADEGTENQIASVFGRLIVPESGVEVYAEFAREDHSGDLRDLLAEPDHTGALMVGVARAWSVREGRVRSIRGELLEAVPNREGLGRPSSRFYTHGGLRQGHTHRGQILGSPAAVGGSAIALRVDDYHPRGRTALYLRREVVADAEIAAAVRARAEDGDDVLYVLGGQQTRFMARASVRWEAAVLANLNRRFGGDRWGFRLGAAATGWF